MVLSFAADSQDNLTAIVIKLTPHDLSPPTAATITPLTFRFDSPYAPPHIVYIEPDDTAEEVIRLIFRAFPQVMNTEYIGEEEKEIVALSSFVYSRQFGKLWTLKAKDTFPAEYLEGREVEKVYSRLVLNCSVGHKRDEQDECLRKGREALSNLPLQVI